MMTVNRYLNDQISYWIGKIWDFLLDICKTNDWKYICEFLLQYFVVAKYTYLLYFLDPDNRAGHTFHILFCGLKVDFIPLIKPNCGWGFALKNTVPGIGPWDHPNRLSRVMVVRIWVRENGKDDIESRLLHNQTRTGELHQWGVGRGAWGYR